MNTSDSQKGHQIQSSMSAVGSCADNAAAESFFGLLKRERVNRRQYRKRAEARTDVTDVHAIGPQNLAEMLGEQGFITAHYASEE